MHLQKKGEKVLLVDADLRRPSLHVIAGAPSGPGLGELLAGYVEKAEPASLWLNLDLLPAGQIQTNPAQLLAAIDLDVVLKPLEERHDRIVIDSPPLAGCADALRIASFADALILVVEANRAEEADVISSIRRVSSVKPPAGAILTKYEPLRAGE